MRSIMINEGKKRRQNIFPKLIEGNDRNLLKAGVEATVAAYTRREQTEISILCDKLPVDFVVINFI